MSYGAGNFPTVEDDEVTETVTSLFGIEVQRRKDHIESLPGTRLRNDLDALNRCSYTIGTNGQELMDHMSTFIESQINVRSLSDQYVMELVRLLHNYLMAVTTLIDAQRVVMRHRWPVEGKDDKRSEFEKTAYSEHLQKTFDPGEAAFMVKLRNYTTHYSIPLPGISTNVSWQGADPLLHVNQLQLDRDSLLLFDGWSAPARRFLQAQEEKFDFTPIIERYSSAVRKFYQWFWDEINSRSAEQIDEVLSKAREMFLWYAEHDLHPDWLTSGGEPPADWNGRKFRASKRLERYEHGTKGYRPIVVSSCGSAAMHDDADAWPLFPR